MNKNSKYSLKINAKNAESSKDLGLPYNFVARHYNKPEFSSFG